MRSLTSGSPQRKFGWGERQFYLDKCEWSPNGLDSKKFPEASTKKYLSNAVVLNRKLYCIGDLESLNSKIAEQHRMQIFDLDSQKWSTSCELTEHKLHEGCLMTVFRFEIYFWSSTSGKPGTFNQFFKYNPSEDVWKTIECDSDVPQERQFTIMKPVNDQYLFLYAGIDLAEDIIYTDSFIFQNHHSDKWKKLDLINPPQPRVAMDIAVCARRLFFYGGELPSENEPMFTDELYEIVVDDIDLKAEFRLVAQKTGKTPGKRASHCTVSISSRYFALFGGTVEGVKHNDFENLWVFDIRECYWIEIELKNGKVPVILESTLLCHENQLYLFGGFKDLYTANTQIVKFTFQEDTRKYTQCCNKCLEHQQKMVAEQPESFYHSQFSVAFLFNLALEIKFPFQGLCHLIEAAEMLEATDLRIRPQKCKEDMECLIVEFNGQSLCDRDFLCLSSHSKGTQRINSLRTALLLGSLRLGKTFMFCTQDAAQRKVFLLSADGKFCPSFEKVFMSYFYIEDLEKELIKPELGWQHKQFIENILKTYLDYPYDRIREGTTNRIFIFAPVVFTTLEKAYYYELVVDQDDVKTFRNEQTIQFLQKVGYDIETHPEYSLKAFLRHWKDTKNLKIYIGQSSLPIKFESYLLRLQTLSQNGEITPLVLPTIQGVESIFLYQCGSEYVQDNNGILLCSNGKVINRFEEELGTMFWQKFYKTKFKKAVNIWNIVGVIEFSANFSPNVISNGFKKSQKYLKCIRKIRSVIEQFETIISRAKQLNEEELIGNSKKKMKSEE